MSRDTRRKRRERTPEQSVALFDKYIVKTGAMMPDIFFDSIVPGNSETDTTEEQLVLYEKKLSKKDIAILTRYIKKRHPFLTKLHINNNNIGIEGAELLGILLSEEETLLQELFLNRNYLYDQGVISIANALKVNKKLRQLKIGYNLAKDEAAKGVADMMIVNKTLRGLEFNGNKYTIRGLGDLADAMNKNDGLKIVQVGDASNIKSRLQFVRMMIQTEDINHIRTDAILCFSKDKDNNIIDLLLEEWRVCKKEGKELINLPREKFDKFRKFNRLTEVDFDDLYEDVKAFLKEAREKGVEKLRQAKIILMGRSLAGKTSLVQSMIAGRSLLTGDGPNRSTSSVEINRWTIKGAKCTFWDFGGQEEYALTHSFFVTPRSVVLVCLNLEEFENTLDDFRYKVQYYIDSIQSHAPGAKFIIVGTHADTVPRSQQRELKETLISMFEEIEQENLEYLNQEYERIMSPTKGDSSPIGEDLQQSFESNTAVKSSHKTTGGMLDELDTDISRSNKIKRNRPNRKVLKKSDLKSSSKLELFDTPGMKVADDFDIEVDKPIKKPVSSNKGPRKLGASFALLNKDSGLSTGMSSAAAKEKIKQERLEKIQKRRDSDSRPQLVRVCLTSSNIDLQGLKELKEVLEDSLVHNHAELDLSVSLPSNYASLYEQLTGESLVLTNPKIEGYKISGMTKVNESKSFKGTRSKRKDKSQKKRSKLINTGFSKVLQKTNTPILDVSTLYEYFVSFIGVKTKGTKRTNSRNKFKKGRLFGTTSDLHNALQSLHEIGYILWYRNNELLKDIVFVDPFWVVKMIKSVIRHDMFEEGEGTLSSIEKPANITEKVFEEMKNRFKTQGVLDSRLLFSFNIWKEADTSQRYHMVNLMQSFDLFCEEVRITERDPFPKYFVPVYLKSTFQQNDDTIQRLHDLENSVLNNVSNVPSSLRALFFDEDPEALLDLQNSKQRLSKGMQQVSTTSTFFESNIVRPKNIQWRYEFENFLPEGLFLRLLVRIYPFISFYTDYRPTDTFLVGKAALGVTIIIQIERNRYGLAGSLILTGIQSEEDNVIEGDSPVQAMRDIWQVFSLFAFEIEDLLSTFPGVASSVLVNIVHPGVGKVSIPRRELETRELMHNSNPNKAYKNISVCIGPENIPMHFLIPPLFVLPREAPGTPNVNFTQPELVRLSDVAKIEYGLIAIEAQIGDEAVGRRFRVQVLHRQLVKYVYFLLKLLVAEISHSTKTHIIMNFQESIEFLKDNNVREIAEMESNIRSIREKERTAFFHPNNRITVGHLRESIRLSWDLFKVLEHNLSAAPPPKRRQNLTF